MQFHNDSALLRCNFSSDRQSALYRLSDELRLQVLDTCAAPGSKTAQILEMLHHGPAAIPTGALDQHMHMCTCEGRHNLGLGSCTCIPRQALISRPPCLCQFCSPAFQTPILLCCQPCWPCKCAHCKCLCSETLRCQEDSQVIIVTLSCRRGHRKRLRCPEVQPAGAPDQAHVQPGTHGGQP